MVNSLLRRLGNFLLKLSHKVRHRQPNICPFLKNERFIMSPLMRKALIVAMFLLLPVSLYGQWLDWRTPGIPRTPDGKPNLKAPAPRTADGKPDLSGIWGISAGKYNMNIASDLKPEDVRPWAME